MALSEQLPGAVQLSNGTWVYEVAADEIESDERLKAKFDQRVEQSQEVGEPIEEDEDDDEDDDEGYDSQLKDWDPEDEYWQGLMRKADQEAYEAVLEEIKGLNVFEEGEEYSTVKDLERAFQKSVNTPLAETLISEMPDHVFQDIKVPINSPREKVEVNDYNQVKAVQNRSFFDWRENAEFFFRRNLNPNTDQHREIKRPY